SEQLRMARHVRELPILMVSGRGGSGKTDACALMFRHVPPEQTGFAAYQSTNAANARSRVTSRSHTLHKMMNMHATHCRKSPYAMPMTKEKQKELKEEMGFMFRKCPF